MRLLSLLSLAVCGSALQAPASPRVAALRARPGMTTSLEPRKPGAPLEPLAKAQNPVCAHGSRRQPKSP